MTLPDHAVEFDEPVPRKYKGEDWETLGYDWSYWYMRKVADGEVIAIAKDSIWDAS